MSALLEERAKWQKARLGNSNAAAPKSSLQSLVESVKHKCAAADAGGVGKPQAAQALKPIVPTHQSIPLYTVAECNAYIPFAQSYADRLCRK